MVGRGCALYDWAIRPDCGHPTVNLCTVTVQLLSDPLVDSMKERTRVQVNCETHLGEASSLARWCS